MAALYDYIDQQIVGENNAHRQINSKITPNYIRKNLIDNPEGYTAELTTTEGPMYRKSVVVMITPAQQKQLRSWYDEAAQLERLVPLGVGLFAVMGLIGATHLLLRRKHGLPVSSPLEGKDVSAAAQLPPVRSGGRGLSILMLLFCILIFPALLVLSLLFVGVTKQHRMVVEAEMMEVESSNMALERELEKAGRQVESELEKASREVEVEIKKATKEVEGRLNEAARKLEGQLRKMHSEKKLEPKTANGQSIIIRVENP